MWGFETPVEISLGKSERRTDLSEVGRRILKDKLSICHLPMGWVFWKSMDPSRCGIDPIDPRSTHLQ
jgi:hypothetical protein